MNKADQIILVTGATGKQGGAVTRHLLKSGWAVRALTRDPQKPAAQALTKLGMEVVQGDMDQPETLPPVLEGVYGVFGVQNTWTAGVEAEIAEGKALIDAAQAAGVKHFVYTSVGGAERNTGISHFESKWLIEQHLRASGLPWSITRPVFFMDNLLANKEDLLKGTWSFGLPPEVPLQMIAVDDIGAFVALAFDHPDEWLGRALELAGDELTGPQTVGKLSAALGREVRYNPVPVEEIAKQDAEWASMLEWFIAYGYKADIPALRELYPPLHDFDQWLQGVNW